MCVHRLDNSFIINCLGRGRLLYNLLIRASGMQSRYNPLRRKVYIFTSFKCDIIKQFREQRDLASYVPRG